MTGETSSPSKLLAQAVEQYCEELISLHNSLVQVMTLLDALYTRNDEIVQKFITEHGRDVVKDASTIKFVVDLEKRRTWTKLERSHKSVAAAKRLLPRNLIVALICSFDSLMGKLVRFILSIRPEILDGSERVLKFSELAEFSDIQTAREYLIEKEIETVLRKSHTDQFKWLESKLNTPFNKNLQSWPSFVELTERRNLFVHCDGIVSSQYITVCKEHKYRFDEEPKVGDPLNAPHEYFDNAYNILYEIGVKLIHVVWRKLLKTELKEVDESLIAISFASIEREEYGVAIGLLEFFTQAQMDHIDEATKRIMIINLAQAHKWKGDDEKCKLTLDAMDWSACEDRFKLAVYVLRGDFEAAYKAMRALVHDDTFLPIYYKEWPLFRKLRSETQFLTVYEECYKQSFKIEKQIVSEQATLPNAGVEISQKSSQAGATVAGD